MDSVSEQHFLEGLWCICYRMGPDRLWNLQKEYEEAGVKEGCGRRPVAACKRKPLVHWIRNGSEWEKSCGTIVEFWTRISGYEERDAAWMSSLSPLKYAAEVGLLPAVKMLLLYDIFVNQEDMYGRTAIVLAVRGDHREIVAALFSHQKTFDAVHMKKICRQAGSELVQDLINVTLLDPMKLY